MNRPDLDAIERVFAPNRPHLEKAFGDFYSTLDVLIAYARELEAATKPSFRVWGELNAARQSFGPLARWNLRTLISSLEQATYTINEQAERIKELEAALEPFANMRSAFTTPENTPYHNAAIVLNNKT